MDVAGARSVVAEGVAEGDEGDVAWLEGPGGMAGGGSIGMAWLVEV